MWRALLVMVVACGGKGEPPVIQVQSTGSAPHRALRYEPTAAKRTVHGR